MREAMTEAVVSPHGEQPADDFPLLQSEVKRERFLALDALRGIAALGVCLHHLQFVSHIRFWTLTQNAYLFVELFFVLSGFVIAHATSGKLRNHADAKRFMIRRVGRVWPLHAVMLAAFVFVEAILYVLVHKANLVLPRQPFSEDRTLLGIPLNFFLIQGLVPYEGGGWNAPSWSISVEMAAYVLFTLTALIPNRLLSTGLRLALMTTALAALLFADAILPIERCVYCFFLGTFIWKLPRRGRFNGTIAEIIAILASIVSLLWTNQHLQFVVCPLIFSVTIYIFSCKKGYISRYFADSKSFIYLGDISYSIYIVHFFVAFSLYNSVKVILPKIGFRITTAPPDLVLINGSMIIMDVLTAMYLVMIVVLASLTYRFVEKPGIRIFGKWAKKYS